MESKKPVTLKLQRSKLVPNKPIRALPRSRRSIPQPQPPGNLMLRLSLGDKIGEGACGLVYEATGVCLAGRSPGYTKSKLPPLVVKIRKNFQPYRLPREAFIYEEMEPLHGLLVARYYGCFETVIPPGVTFPVWQMEKEVYNSDLINLDHPNIPRVVTMIIMERLGDQHLPVGEPPEDSTRYATFYLL